MKEFTGHDLTPEEFKKLYGMTEKTYYKKLNEAQKYHREQMEKAQIQTEAWDEYMGGENAKVGQDWDVWNRLGITWKLYNQYKNENGYTDEEIIALVTKHI